MDKPTLQHLKETYHAEEASHETCRAYLEPQERFLLGLHLRDASANFRLLNEADLFSLTDSQRNLALDTQKSPYGDLLLIFYQDQDPQVSFKLIHGRASRLIWDLEDLCDHPELFAE